MDVFRDTSKEEELMCIEKWVTTESFTGQGRGMREQIRLGRHGPQLRRKTGRMGMKVTEGRKGFQKE